MRLTREIEVRERLDEPEATMPSVVDDEVLVLISSSFVVQVAMMKAAHGQLESVVQNLTCLIVSGLLLSSDSLIVSHRPLWFRRPTRSASPTPSVTSHWPRLAFRYSSGILRHHTIR